MRVNITDTEVALFRGHNILGVASMTNQADNALQSANDDKATSIETVDNFYTGISSAQKAAEAFIGSMKDLYQELKSAPSNRANIS